MRLDRPDAEALLQAATCAALEAHRNGPSAIRSYSATLRDAGRSARNALADEVGGALDRGEFVRATSSRRSAPDGGALTGVEALARWRHPVARHDPAVGVPAGAADRGPDGRARRR